MWQGIIYKKDRDPDELHFAVCTNYYKRGLGLPSGRFAELEKIFWSQHETSLGLGHGCCAAVEYRKNPPN